MKRIVWWVVAAACQSGSAGTSPPTPTPAAPPTPAPAPRAVTPEYRQDIANLCDAVHLSKADEQPEAERWPLVAMWLGPNIKTSEARDFLVAIQPLTGDPKANALDGEARRVGLAGCAISAEWRRP